MSEVWSLFVSPVTVSVYLASQCQDIYVWIFDLCDDECSFCELLLLHTSCGFMPAHAYKYCMMHFSRAGSQILLYFFFFTKHFNIHLVFQLLNELLV